MIAVGSLLASRLVLKQVTRRRRGLGHLNSLILFFKSCFVRRQSVSITGAQQEALENFYKGQAGDAIRKGTHVNARRETAKGKG